MRSFMDFFKLFNAHMGVNLGRERARARAGQARAGQAENLGVFEASFASSLNFLIALETPVLFPI